MRTLGTELNMLARLGFPRDEINLEEHAKEDIASHEIAWDKLMDGNYAHVLYAVTYRGKRARNKTPLHIELASNAIECFNDDASFFRRCDKLYAKGVYWIGAFHAKN